MRRADWDAALSQAYRAALRHLDRLPDEPVRPDATNAEIRAVLGGPLPEAGTDPATVVAELAAAAEPGLMATPGGRFFGFVVGGATPAALAADWLVSAWDQNVAHAELSPAACAAEEVCGGWLRELFGLPAHASFGLVTGGQAANLVGLAAARNAVLRRVGWDVEDRGLIGAPPVRVFAGEQRHATIDRALRMLGLGAGTLTVVPADGQGRMDPTALAALLADVEGPAIVCAQAGGIDTGGFDPFAAVCAAAHAVGAWVHVDGAFGLWAAVSPRLRYLVDGMERADSWATDAHKWLNVPYDCGVVFCAHPEAHRAAMGLRAHYITSADAEHRDPYDYNPELSRRARGFPVYAAIRSLGRDGIVGMIERSCALATRFAERLAGRPGIEVCNDVVLNQVLVRFGDDAHTLDVIRRVKQDGTCWMSGTTWQGRAAMRISVTNWSTDEQDVDSSVEALVRCAKV